MNRLLKLTLVILTLATVAFNSACEAGLAGEAGAGTITMPGADPVVWNPAPIAPPLDPPVIAPPAGAVPQPVTDKASVQVPDISWLGHQVEYFPTEGDIPREIANLMPDPSEMWPSTFEEELAEEEPDFADPNQQKPQPNCDQQLSDARRILDTTAKIYVTLSEEGAAIPFVSMFIVDSVLGLPIARLTMLLSADSVGGVVLGSVYVDPAYRGLKIATEVMHRGNLLWSKAFGNSARRALVDINGYGFKCYHERYRPAPDYVDETGQIWKAHKLP